MADWREYEQLIEERLRKLADPQAEILFDHTLVGKHSRARRQVDIFVRGTFAGRVAQATMAVDCKCWSSNVDVSDADRFVGFIDDLGVDLGLLVTTHGFSEAAKLRAEAARGVKCDVVPFEELEDWRFPDDVCDVCYSPDDDRMPGLIEFQSPEDFDILYGAELVRGIGECLRCFSLYILCGCRSVTSVAGHTSGSWQECEGGCGMLWKVDESQTRYGTSHEMSFRRAGSLGDAR